jgi:hypothetical protein
MLGKYYSIFLIAGLMFAAIVHPQRSEYLRSRAPWLSVAAGLIAISPHVYWLAQHDFGPFHYATESHAGRSFVFSAKDAAAFLITNTGYLVLAVAAWLVMTRSKWSENLSDLKSMNPSLKLLTLVLVGSFVSPIVVVLVIGSNLPSSWQQQGLFLVILITVCATRFAVPRFEAVNLTAMLVLLSVGFLLTAPLQAVYHNTRPLSRNFYHQAAEVITNEWRNAYGSPLESVCGDDGLAFGTVFYSKDHPFYAWPFECQYDGRMPRPIARGWSALCFAENPVCMAWMSEVASHAPNVKRWNFEVQSKLWGMPGASATIAAMMTPPPMADIKKPNEGLPDYDADEVSAQQRNQ